LWFPKGQGESFLYKDTLQIFSKKGILLESKPIQFGIRKTELVQEKDEWGTSYYLKINNKPVFSKGANLIPPSVFPGQITDAVWEEQIQLMKEKHFNMVRIWGGGLYPSDYFLKRCDEEGIMVWQDFMFACAMYPADSLFLANVREELNCQIPRIADHPAVVLFNGNNEVDVAWKNWGLQKQYHLTQSDSIQIASDYKLLFRDQIPTWVSSFTDIPYVHTSPLSNWGAPERYNHGSQHYWGVWHGTDPISDFSKNIGRFNAEFGYQSFPEYSTLNEIAPETTWNLDSLAIKKHQKSYVGNGKILAEIKKSFPQPNNFMEFVYYSQLIQADAMEQAISAHRLNAPRCMGSIYWQLNDCYPGPTWSSVDYLGNRKILHYRMKEMMQPVTVLQEEDKNGFNLLITSDLPQVQKVRYKITGIVKMKDKWIRDDMKTDSIQLNTLESQSIFSESALNSYFIANAVHALEVSWQVDAQTYSRIFWIKNQPHHKADNRVVKLKISKMDRKNKSLVLKLKVKQPIQHFWLYSTQQGIRYSENDITLLPGKKEITIHFETVPKSRDFKWLGLNTSE
jgi:beta-mannosidase